jgi:hypothetical protein
MPRRVGCCFEVAAIDVPAEGFRLGWLGDVRGHRLERQPSDTGDGPPQKASRAQKRLLDYALQRGLQSNNLVTLQTPP